MVKKRVEDVLKVLLGDADSGIAKFDPDLRGVVSLGADPELPAPGHGLNGVGNQVQKHLPQGILVGKTRPHLTPRGLDGDMMVGQVFLHQLERLAQQIVQIDRLQLGAAVARNSSRLVMISWARAISSLAIWRSSPISGLSVSTIWPRS